MNSTAWWWSFGWAGFALVPMAIVHVGREPGQAASFSVGEVMPVALLPAVVVGFLAWGSGNQWRWWAYGLAVTLSAFGLFVAQTVLPEVADNARAEASGEADYVLVIPERAGTWHRLDGEAAQGREAVVRDRFEEAPDDVAELDFLYGEFQRSPGERLYFMGITGWGELEETQGESPEQAIANFLAGSGLPDGETFDAGDLGGAMMCTDEAPRLPEDVIVCGWADASTTSQLTFVVDGLDLEGAAELTRGFREHVTQR